MAKAVPADIEALGFKKEQFGTPADWSTASPAGYLQKILDDVALETQNKVGASTYTAATTGTLNFKRLKNAEAWFAAGALWRRRVQFIESAAAVSNSEDDYLTQREYLNHAATAEAAAWAELALVTAEAPDSGVRVGYVETGPYSGAGA